jgi:hypothetical protein
VTASLRIAAAALFVLAALAVTVTMSAPNAESHPGHTEKKLFEGHWHYEPNGDYESWMNLSTSDLWINCAIPLPCHTRWIGNFTDSIDDWNGQPTTVDFDWTDGDYDEFYDINVVIEDDLGDPGLLGIGPSYDEFGDLCIGPCDVWYGVVWISDESHSGPYGTYDSRTGTTAHELGHLLQLRHESVNADESVLYECGFDDTGPIPHSVMSYDCIDPPAVGGEGEYWVQPFDVCGVNHASFDPTYGYAGCDGTLDTPTPTAQPSATPTPPPTPTSTPGPTDTATPEPSSTATPPPTGTPAPTQSGGQSPPPAETDTPTPEPTPEGVERVWGDINCSGASDPIDSLLILRYDAGLSVNTPAGCPLPDATVVASASAVEWADVDCGGSANPIDALKLLRADSGLPVNQPLDCPDIGETIFVVEAVG